MEKEISSGTMLGIVLIALAAVIGLGFGVFSIAKGVANEGTVNVQDNLAVVSDSSFDDYNDKIVTGTMVKSAVQNFSGKSVAILINTTAMNKEVVTYNKHASMQTVVFSVDDKGAATVTAGSLNGGETFDANEDGNNYVNYNALLDFTNDSFALYLEDGIYIAEAIPFQISPADGKVQFDYSIGGFARTGNCEYLNATAKFDANLIKDETGTNIGIVFTQRAQ